MTPAELYKREPESIDHTVSILNGCYYAHVPELEHDVLPYEDQNQRVSIRYYKNFDFDSRRFWRLASVWYETNNCESKPFMIIQNAGREGDDHHKRFVTDTALYYDAVSYLKTICVVNDVSINYDEVDPNVDIPDLTSFYNHELDDQFNRTRW